MIFYIFVSAYLLISTIYHLSNLFLLSQSLSLANLTSFRSKMNIIWLSHLLTQLQLLPWNFPCNLCILNPATLFKGSFSLASLRQLPLMTTCLWSSHCTHLNLLYFPSLLSFPGSSLSFLCLFSSGTFQNLSFQALVWPYRSHMHLQTCAICCILYFIWLYNTSIVTVSQNIKIILIFSSFSLYINSNEIFHFCLRGISWINPLFLSLSICPGEGTISFKLYYCRSFIPDSSNYTLFCVSYLTQCYSSTAKNSLQTPCDINLDF